MALRSGVVPEEDMSLLEIAAGTGRQHTFLKDNWPMMQTVVSDLSPFYLQVYMYPPPHMTYDMYPPPHMTICRRCTRTWSTSLTLTCILLLT